MFITKQELIDLNACETGIDRFIDQTNNTSDPVDVTSLVGGKNTYSDLLWLAGEKINRDRIVRFACDCALINIEKIKPYADKYDLIVSFLKDPSADARAVYSAYSAARAAYSAAAADARAADAYSAAAYAAYAADAASRAADAAADAAYAANAAADARAADAAAVYAADYAAYAAGAAGAATYAAYATDAAGERGAVNKLLIDMFNEY